MKTVGVYFHLHESYIDKALLELEGIESFVMNENSFSVKPDGFQPNVMLQVREENFEKALDILNQHKEEE